MTGMSILIEREGRWQSIEVDLLTDAELDSWARRMQASSPYDGWNWAVALARWVRERGRGKGPLPVPDVEAAARVDLFVREVDRLIQSMPERFRGEASAELARVIEEARRKSTSGGGLSR